MIHNSLKKRCKEYLEPIFDVIGLEAGASFLEGSFGEDNHPGGDVTIDPENIFDL